MEEKTNELLQQAIMHHRSGEIALAENTYIQILKVDKTHTNALHNLGVLRKINGYLGEALQLFKQALALEQRNQTYWLSYIDALISAKNFFEVQKNINLAIDAGMDCKELSILEEKMHTSSKSLLNKPTISEHALIRLFQEESYEKTIENANSFIAYDPNNPIGWKLLGGSLLKLGKRFDAITALEKADSLSPNQPDILNTLGVAYRQIGDISKGKETYEKIIKLQPKFAPAYNNLGLLLALNGNTSAAEKAYRQAIRINKNYSSAYNNLGTLKQMQGAVESALKMYQLAKTSDVHNLEAHRNFSALHKFKHDDKHFLLLKSLEKKKLGTVRQTHLKFSLAKAYSDIKDYRTAFEYYVQANALRKQTLGYTFGKDQKLFTGIKEVHKNSAVSGFATSSNDNVPTPIFIIGMPRSGTTLVEQIISAHPSVHGGGELKLLDQAVRKAVKGRNLSQLDIISSDIAHIYLQGIARISQGQRFVTDKMPQNFLHLGFIARSLGNARIVHIKRSAKATCWANFSQYFVNDNIGFCYDLKDTVDYYLAYEDLMGFWERKFPDLIYSVNYENLTENPEAEIRSILNHVGLRFDERCLNPEKNNRIVTTASNVQVKNAIYTGSSNKWKNFEPFIGDVFDCLPG